MSGSPTRGCLGGLVGIVLGGSLWAAVTVWSGYQLGLMALAVGFIAATLVRLFGQGESTLFGFIGAVSALLGIMLGNYLALAIIVADNSGLTVTEAFTRVGEISNLIQTTFNLYDLIFYGLAVYIGFRYSYTPQTM